MAITLEEMALQFTTQGDEKLIASLQAADKNVNVLKSDVATLGTQSSASFQKVAAGAQHASQSIGMHAGAAGGHADALTHKLNHLGVQGSFVLTALAEGSERGLARFAHGVANIGFMVGGLGGIITTFVAIAGEQFIAWTEEGKKKLEEFEKAIREFSVTVETSRLERKGTDLLSQAREHAVEIQAATNIINETIEEGQKKADALKKTQGGSSGLIGHIHDIEKGVEEAIKPLQEQRKKLQSELDLLTRALRDLPSGLKTEGVGTVTTTSTRLGGAPTKEELSAFAYAEAQKAAAKMAALVMPQGGVAGSRLALGGHQLTTDADFAAALKANQKFIDEKARQNLIALDAENALMMEHERVVAGHAQRLAALTAGAFDVLLQPGGGMKKLGEYVMTQLGDVFVKLGEKMIAASSIFRVAAEAIASFSPEGSLVAGLALIALGSAMRNSGGHGGGGGGGGYSGGGGVSSGHSYYGSVGPTNPPSQGITRGATMPAATTPVIVHQTIIGANDPVAQRNILELIAVAQRRGSTSG